MKITIELDIDEKKILGSAKEKLVVGDNRALIVEKMVQWGSMLQTVAAQLEGVGFTASVGEPPGDSAYYCPVHGYEKKPEPPKVCAEHGTVYAEHEGCPLCTGLVVADPGADTPPPGDMGEAFRRREDLLDQLADEAEKDLQERRAR